MVDIWHLGHACFKIKGKNVSVVIDPYNSDFTGLSKLKTEADIVCVTHQHEDHNFTEAVSGVSEEKPFVIYGPGEYEKLGAVIVGISSFHDDKSGGEKGKNTIYAITIDGVTIVHLGDFGQKKLTQDQVEYLSSCDILMIPTGGVYTIEPGDAPDIIAQIEPKIIIPMHYKTEGLKFDLAEVSQFLTVMGKENVEKQSKLSVNADKLPEESEIVLLEIQK